ncbi:Apoptosis inhibitory 5 [Arabidopsis suecica]|uniref:Apoptosis inhibitory 5 n=1 Tax=Arabidopsis suecica TaxID=45249 RepID=A0A8T2B728_ARASU|nr:Apoptosis inhibitory 5 [Arabidopsis suecica]
MVDQYSEDANHMEKLKEFDKRLRESKDKSHGVLYDNDLSLKLQNLQDYEGIIEFSKMSIETKELGVDLIPQYFQFYASHSNQAFDAYNDIIEAVDVNITVRVQAIRNLPLFCKDASEFVSKIIDVLVQCLDIDQQE